MNQYFFCFLSFFFLEESMALEMIRLDHSNVFVKTVKKCLHENSSMVFNDTIAVKIQMFIIKDAGLPDVPS